MRNFTVAVNNPDLLAGEQRDILNDVSKLTENTMCSRELNFYALTPTKFASSAKAQNNHLVLLDVRAE